MKELRYKLKYNKDFYLSLEHKTLVLYFLIKMSTLQMQQIYSNKNAKISCFLTSAVDLYVM